MRALGLREFAGLSDTLASLDPYALAGYAGLVVVDFDSIEGLSESSRGLLLGESKDSWSGGAASQILPGGQKLIILNPTQKRNRHAATLMEEICHVFLGHRPSRLAIQERDRDGNISARDYDPAIEEEAYSVGAAALAPYSGLKRLIAAGRTASQMARHYGVSRALIDYRLKVTKLWKPYTSRIFDPQV